MPIYRPDPVSPTPEGDRIRTLVSEILVELDDLESRLTRPTAAIKLSALERKIEDRIAALNSARQMAAALGDETTRDDCHIRVQELRGLLLENGE